MIAAEGQFAMWELKVTHANAVRISPHQIAFAESHKKYPVWFLVCCANPEGETIKAYHASSVRQLAKLGVKYPAQLEITPPDWTPLLDLILTS